MPVFLVWLKKLARPSKYLLTVAFLTSSMVAFFACGKK